jgi:predicted enzyme related to lactoylglutathione lyase
VHPVSFQSNILAIRTNNALLLRYSQDDEETRAEETGVLRGFTTVNYWADDPGAAKEWYAELLGIDPYFERPGYAEFRLGDYQHELGIVDSSYAPAGPAGGPGGGFVYWHVDDVAATMEELLTMGAEEYLPITPREGGFVTAAVVDPFGNVLGIMYNPHYLDVLGSKGGRETS